MNPPLCGGHGNVMDLALLALCWESFGHHFGWMRVVEVNSKDAIERVWWWGA